MPTSQPANKTMARAIAQAVALLSSDENQVRRARIAGQLAALMRDASEQFAEQRSDALNELRALGWSLADMKAEFGIARARASQVVNRDDYRRARRERRRT